MKQRYGWEQVLLAAGYHEDAARSMAPDLAQAAATLGLRLKPRKVRPEPVPPEPDAPPAPDATP